MVVKDGGNLVFLVEVIVLIIVMNKVMFVFEKFFYSVEIVESI